MCWEAQVYSQHLEMRMGEEVGLPFGMASKRILVNVARFGRLATG